MATFTQKQLETVTRIVEAAFAESADRHTGNASRVKELEEILAVLDTEADVKVIVSAGVRPFPE